ncbi:hypothetical protein DSO57_1017961 [Entomophthora muscae]|uniref:Uncharacterized protein n=1 Tax=Entomophthora muscae TaxID=34485 RepID=A0ACC2SHH1_9FUNG|nr:hypothetical protein DSO57_1017961 [Entomophthora muscae]
MLAQMSTSATNQELTQERGTGPQPSPMTTTLEQDNQVANLRFLINERTPGPSAILPPLKPCTQIPRAVTSDKLLLTMLIGKPQLRDSNPDTLWAASLQDQPPGCLQIFVLKPEQDSTSGNPLKLDEPKSPTSTLPMLKVPVNPTNQRVGQVKDPSIT